MPKRIARCLRHVSSAEILAAYRNERDYELLDAIVTAAALISRADGWVQPVERGAMLDFLARNQFLPPFARESVLALFEDRMRDLREPDGAIMAVIRLRDYARRSSNSVGLIVDMAREIAAADCRLDPREQSLLQLIDSALYAELSSLYAGLSSLASGYRPGQTAQ
ncbi:MAG: TerB family tellurite resistance protein [Acetobacteraceae bacterium]